MIEQAPRPPRRAPPVAIRDAGGDDLDAVMAIMDAAFEPTYGEAWTRSQCAGILPMAGRVAAHRRRATTGAVAGFALMRAIADEAELLLIAVDPARPAPRHRRRVGRRFHRVRHVARRAPTSPRSARRQ